jgi:fructose-bisphosphate aldolase class I
MVLKPNMVLPGSSSRQQSSPEEVARVTVDTLRATIADGVAGIAFLSGGQLPHMATANLAAMSQIDTPWPLTFSFGRALVSPPLLAWHGDSTRATDAQAVLAKLVSDNVAVLRQRKP